MWDKKKNDWPLRHTVSPWWTAETFNTLTGHSKTWANSWRWNQTVSTRWSSPDRRHGCEHRRHILCSIQWALLGLGRWPNPSSSGRYLWHILPVSPRGSLAPHLASCLLAAGVCSLDGKQEKKPKQQPHDSVLYSSKCMHVQQASKSVRWLLTHHLCSPQFIHEYIPLRQPIRLS